MSEFKTNVVLESLVSLVETPDGDNYDTKLLEIVKDSFPEFYTQCKELNRLSDIGERLMVTHPFI